ncbi:small glutamine-rich tetratricopeptide repeat-containing protein 2 [Panicum miliaceum]|uniref:Small glutamine-rich tetratricopeptide repeat-containing protein 2 n=1 Tax=Panicum miliaceum TaxID=4540 RepID=A0A3L6Q950_PANMI|nr:small glutamine-rich tetratricopeptide repeat-containing protein 2 [Panicum miliaceum]
MAVAVAVAGVTTNQRSCCLASAHRRTQHCRRRPAPPRASGAMEVRVCTNRTCARQGGREDLAPPRVDVDSCGCLGRCGAGPNLAASVGGSAAVIGLNACGGMHLVYRSRSKARLAIGDISGALEDAEEAIRISPKFTQAHLLRGDALLAMGEYCAAENAYADALDLDPSIRDLPCRTTISYSVVAT